MKVFLFALLLSVGCNRSAHMHANASISVDITAPAKECDQIHDEAERKICLTAVADQKKLDAAKQQPASQPK